MKGLCCAIVSLLCHAAMLVAASTNTLERGSEYNIRIWETDQGLPKNTVLAIRREQRRGESLLAFQ